MGGKSDEVVNIEDRLIEKSIEAFVLAIEIFNKPSIKYRVEGFSFFICNAWELMLKAHLIKVDGPQSIYYKDNPGRTISLDNCIKTVFTNHNDPLRLNLERIIQLRNTSTHFITTEYEMVYIPLFQACVFNFSNKMQDFHDVDITDYIPQTFLNLQVTVEELENTQIIAKYPEEIAQKLISMKSEIDETSSVKNPGFAIKIEHHHYIVKDKSRATSLVRIDNSAESNVTIIKELQDPNKTHPYTTKSAIEAIKGKLHKLNIDIRFNKYVFGLFVDYYELKGNERYHYSYSVGTTTFHSYSQQVVDLIINEIKKDPENIVDNIKESIKERKGDN